METLSPYDNEDESAAPAAAAAAPVNARACASDEDNGNFWGKSNNLDLSKDPHPVNHGPSATLSDLGTFTRHPELTPRIGYGLAKRVPIGRRTRPKKPCIIAHLTA